MPKYCVSCGEELKKGSKFCQGCGAKVEETPPAPIQPETSPKQQPAQPQPIQPMPIQTPQKPKTKLIATIAAIIVAVVVVVSVLYFVVFQNNTVTSDTSSFVGSWNVDYLVGSSNPNLVWSFYQNGTLKSEQLGYDPIWSNYEISGGRLCLSSNEYTYYHCYDYEFTGGGTSLTLSARSITSVRMAKII